MLPLLHRHIFFPLIVAFLIVAVTPLRGEDVSVEKVFATVPFDQWVEQGRVTAVPWKVTVESRGLSRDQRLGALIHVELAQRELIKFSQGARVMLLLQVSDEGGRNFRDCRLNLQDVKPRFEKGKIDVSWGLFVLPGDYEVTLVLVNALNGKHNLRRLQLHVNRLKNDPLPESWTGLPAVESIHPELKTPDSPPQRLHLPVTPRRVVRMEVLVDMTESDLLQGSRGPRAHYQRYLTEAMLLLKLLSQISVERGSLNVAMLDVHRQQVIFEQDDVKELDWPRASSVVPKTNTRTIDIRELTKRREGPVFFQDELLRRLTLPHAGQVEGDDTVHVFVIIDSHMDYYSLHGFPHLPPGAEERCVVYYLQVDLLNPAPAKAAVDNMRKMLAPLPLRVFQVGSAESVRHALAKILEEVGKM
jgi:hypothetical protein